MGEMANSNTTAEKAPKKSWFKGLKAEFKKIVWPDKETLTKQSVVVIIATVIIGIIIYLLDYVIDLGLHVLLG